MDRKIEILHKMNNLKVALKKGLYMNNINFDSLNQIINLQTIWLTSEIQSETFDRFFSFQCCHKQNISPGETWFLRIIRHHEEISSGKN